MTTIVGWCENLRSSSRLHNSILRNTILFSSLRSGLVWFICSSFQSHM